LSPLKFSQFFLISWPIIRSNSSNLEWHFFGFLIIFGDLVHPATTERNSGLPICSPKDASIRVVVDASSHRVNVFITVAAITCTSTTLKMNWEAGTLVLCVLPYWLSSLCNRLHHKASLTDNYPCHDSAGNKNRAGDFQQTYILICCQLYEICHAVSVCGQRIGKLDTFIVRYFSRIVVLISFTIFDFRRSGFVSDFNFGNHIILFVDPGRILLDVY
jgi:hypothetical protein